MDIYETDKEIVVTAELPGVKKEDINIEITPNNELKLTGERKYEKTEENERFYRSERSWGSFQR
jgi:HSP20 family protein